MDGLENTSNRVSNDQKGASNATIVLMVMALLIVVIIGTWIVLNSISPAALTEQPAKEKAVNNDNGQVSVTILPENKDRSSDSGQITINIEP